LKNIKNNIQYDLKKSPQKYLPYLITINRLIDDLSKKRNKDYKLFNVIPLRTSIVPKYITIDTAALVSLFSGQADYFNNLVKNSNKIWSGIFNLKKNCFKRSNHEFFKIIKTDGI